MSAKTLALVAGWFVLLIGSIALAVYASAGFRASFAAAIQRAQQQAATTHRAAPTPDPVVGVHDAGYQELLAYRRAARQEYDNRSFDALERRAQEARASKAKFSNGTWKIIHFYEAFECRASEPESMWTLHKTIHEEWVAAKPASITARTAQMDFLVSYAWHARGSDYANRVTPEGWRLFAERFREAHQVFDGSKDLPEKCPQWWSVALALGLGEEWPREEYDRVWAAGKAYEPTFWAFDTRRSNFLATKWYGQPGEWERAAEAAAAEPGGMGMEIYARCVWLQSSNYSDVFKQSNATWTKTKEGCELLRQRYPDSTEVASAYCRLACLARDRPTAKKLFDVLGDGVFANYWHGADRLRLDREWAAGTE